MIIIKAKNFNFVMINFYEPSLIVAILIVIDF